MLLVIFRQGARTSSVGLTHRRRQRQLLVLAGSLRRRVQGEGEAPVANSSVVERPTPAEAAMVEALGKRPTRKTPALPPNALPLMPPPLPPVRFAASVDAFESARRGDEIFCPSV